MSADPVDPPVRDRPRRRPQRATSEELVAAAIRVITREGVAATTTRKIAVEAGVPLGAVHYWFADKDALLEAVVVEVVRQIDLAVGAGRSDGSPQDALRAGLRAAWAQVSGDDPGAQLGMYELTAMALRTPALRDLARRQYRRYREITREAVTPITADLSVEQADTLVQLVAVTFDGLTLSWLADPEGTEPERVLDLLAEAVSHLLTRSY